MQSPSSPLPAQDRLQAQPCLVDCSGKAYFSPVGGGHGVGISHSSQEDLSDVCLP